MGKINKKIFKFGAIIAVYFAKLKYFSWFPLVTKLSVAINQDQQRLTVFVLNVFHDAFHFPYIFPAKLGVLILLEACLVRRSHYSPRPMRFWSCGTSGLGNVSKMYWPRMPAWKEAVPRCQMLFSKMSYNANAARGSATGLPFNFTVPALYLQRKWSVVSFRDARLVQWIKTDIG